MQGFWRKWRKWGKWRSYINGWRCSCKNALMAGASPNGWQGMDCFADQREGERECRGKLWANNMLTNNEESTDSSQCKYCYCYCYWYYVNSRRNVESEKIRVPDGIWTHDPPWSSGMLLYDILCSILGILLHFCKRLRSKITDPILPPLFFLMQAH